MSNFLPWKILHIEMRHGLPTQIAALEGYQGLYIVFWWQNVPLGRQVIEAEQLPLSITQLVQCISSITAPAVGSYLLPQDFEMPLSEYFFCQVEGIAPELDSVIAIEKPLSKLQNHFSQLHEQLEETTVSVIICTRDRPQELCRCLKSIQDLSHCPQEIIVVDNAPETNQTEELIKNFPNIRYILEPQPGLSIARNTGIRVATGDVIAFTDDDVVVHPDWILHLKRGFQTPQIMAVTGLVLPAELETESQVVFEIGNSNLTWEYRGRTFQANFLQANKHLGVPVWRIGAGANMAFRRKVFDQVGEFDERLGAGASGCSEDSEIWYRILANGWHCRYEPAAVIYHYHRRDLQSLNDQMYQYMRGHGVALLLQFTKHWHWGNLYRLLFALPKHYFGMLAGGLIYGFRLKHRTLRSEITGYLAGIYFYLKYCLFKQDRSNL